MQINKILDDKLEKAFEIVIPFATVDEKAKEVAEKRQKNYRLDGFRPGKVPLAEIIRREKTPLFYESSDELINEVINKLLEENNFKLSSQAEVDFTNLKEDEDVALKVTFELVPEVGEIDFDKIKLKTYKIKIDEKDVDNSFTKITDNCRKLEDKNDTTELGDTVKINFEGFVNGETFNGGKGEEFNLKLGSHTFIDNFEEQLVGKKSGDKVDVNVRFPDTYHSSQLAGKDALFKVEILNVLIPNKDEIDDDFIKENFGVDSVEKMKDAIKAELEKDYSTALSNKAKNDLINELDSDFDFDLPPKALAKRIDILKKYRRDLNENDLEKEAKKNLKCGFILSEIGNKNNLDVTGSEITEAIMKEVSYYPGREKQIIDMYKNNQNMLESLKAQILEDKIIAYILDKIAKDEEEITIEEFTKL